MRARSSGGFTGRSRSKPTSKAPSVAQIFVADAGRVWLYPRVKTGGGFKFLPSKGLLWQIVSDRAVNRKRMQVFYTGKVQGVGFRYTVKTVATGFELTGTVRNLSDGRVELIAEGVREELEAFRDAIRDSGLGHFVQKEAVSWGDAQNEFRGFEIVR